MYSLEDDSSFRSKTVAVLVPIWMDTNMAPSYEALLIWANNFFTYRNIPTISPGAYIFQRPFLRGLVLEELIFGGASLLREICVYKSIGLAL